MFICMMNRLSRQEDPATNYKAYVGKGNNSVMVKNILKNRFWWTLVQEPDTECNLTWTQGRDQKLIRSMKKHYEQEKLMKSKGKLNFHLKVPNKEDIKVTPVKEYTKYGLSKLISDD